MPHTACATIATATIFRPCSQEAWADVAEQADAIGEEHEGDGGGKREAAPSRKSAEKARPSHAERDADLAARRAWQKLRERDQVGVDRLVEPTSSLYELGAKVAEVRDRPAKGREAEAQEGREDLRDRAIGTRNRDADFPAEDIRHGR